MGCIGCIDVLWMVSSLLTKNELHPHLPPHAATLEEVFTSECVDKDMKLALLLLGGSV